MSPEQKTAVLTGALSQAQAQVDVLTEALALHTDGYKSDQVFIASQVAAGIDAAVAVAVAPLNQQIADLTAQVVALTPAPVVLADTPA